MHGLREILKTLALPPSAAAAGGYALPEAHRLGCELPQGHLHVWSAPPGPEKTALFLGLAYEAAKRGRPALLATYDLPAATLALRLVALESGVRVAALDGGTLTADERSRAAAARARLDRVPLFFLEARGLTVASLEDRVVRSPVRIDLLGVDFVEAVVRRPDAPLAAAYRDLADLAHRRWISVLAVARTAPVGREVPPPAAAADRVGRIEPPDDHGLCEAILLSNRHGPRHTCRLRLDAGSGRLLADDAQDRKA